VADRPAVLGGLRRIPEIQVRPLGPRVEQHLGDATSRFVQPPSALSGRPATVPRSGACRTGCGGRSPAPSRSRPAGSRRSARPRRRPSRRPAAERGCRGRSTSTASPTRCSGPGGPRLRLAEPPLETIDQCAIARRPGYGFDVDAAARHGMIGDRLTVRASADQATVYGRSEGPSRRPVVDVDYIRRSPEARDSGRRGAGVWAGSSADQAALRRIALSPQLPRHLLLGPGRCRRLMAECRVARPDGPPGVGRRERKRVRLKGGKPWREAGLLARVGSVSCWLSWCEPARPGEPAEDFSRRPSCGWCLV
jgi:hypothetical protein